jgi:hypothetical protein
LLQHGEWFTVRRGVIVGGKGHQRRVFSIHYI